MERSGTISFPSCSLGQSIHRTSPHPGFKVEDLSPPLHGRSVRDLTAILNPPQYYYPYFIQEEIEAQRSEIIYIL